MKKRIGWLNNKPIIQGDKNLKNSNELHIDELSSSNSGGGEGTSKIHYYRFDSNAVIKEFKNIGAEDEGIIIFFNFFCNCANAHIYNDDDGTAGIHYRGYTPNITSMWDTYRVEALLIDEDIYFGQYPYITKGDLYIKINHFIKVMTKQSPEEGEMIKSVFGICLKHTTEITEDEFFGMCKLPITPLPE